MTVPFDAANPGDGALGLYSAVGDALAGHRLGFGLRRAALAAAFAQHRGAGEDSIAGNWFAGLLAEIGHVDVVVAADATDRTRMLAFADAPLHGARIVRALPGIPPRTSDVIRWHREHDDGTGFPDRLRWDGIPADAAALGIVHAFLEVLEDPQEVRSSDEALFAILAENGRRFRIDLVRAFREFLMRSGSDWEAMPAPAAAPEDPALVPRLADRLDERAARSAGRSARTAALAGILAERLGADHGRAQLLARLLALGNAVGQPDEGNFDPLSRFARERRAAGARRAAEIAGAVPAYRGDAAALVESAAWHGPQTADPLAPIVGLAAAVDGLDPHDAPRLVAAASGTHFDPAVVRVYLATLGAPT